MDHRDGTWGRPDADCFARVADAQARGALRSSIAVRTKDGATFLGSQTRDLMDREKSVAQQYLAGPRVSAADFARVSRALSLDRAVLLDMQGTALFILPHNPAVIGRI